MKRRSPTPKQGEPSPKKRRIDGPTASVEVIVSLDIETIELEMFAIGAAVVHLTKQGDEYSVTVSQKRRWSIPRDFPQETASDFPFWTQFRSVYDELQSEAIPPEEMARKFN